MPTATAELDFSRSDRDMLCGWSAEGSERFSKQAVSATFKSADQDPLAEMDDIDFLGQFFLSWNVQDDEILRTKRLLVSRTNTDVQRELPTELPGDVMELLPADLIQDDFLDGSASMKKELSREKQQSWNRSRSEVLGDDHKQEGLQFGRSLSLDIIYTLRERSASKFYTDWDSAICFLESIT